MTSIRSPPEGQSIDAQGRRCILLLEDGRIAKMGQTILRQEADNLKFIREHTTIPVPEVFDSYDIEGGGHCIIMSRVPGITLQEAWPQLSNESKSCILDELIGYVHQLRQLQGTTISSASGSPTGMYVFGSTIDNVLMSPSEFHDFLTSRVYPKLPRDYVSYLRTRFDDNARLLFTHADLMDRNILVKDGKISGIVDWEWAGFYPEHWEFIMIMSNSAWPMGWGNRMLAEFTEYANDYLTYNALQYISPK
jgi:aminoglycoside phosphotransferase (APT) family kinase protein